MRSRVDILRGLQVQRVCRGGGCPERRRETSLVSVPAGMLAQSMAFGSQKHSAPQHCRMGAVVEAERKAASGLGVAPWASECEGGGVRVGSRLALEGAVVVSWT